MTWVRGASGGIGFFAYSGSPTSAGCLLVDRGSAFTLRPDASLQATGIRAKPTRTVAQQALRIMAWFSGREWARRSGWEEKSPQRSVRRPGRRVSVTGTGKL